MFRGTRQGVAEQTFDTFGCDVFEANPPTPDRLTPDRTFEVSVRFGVEVRTPDFRPLEMWTINETNAREDGWPGPTLRMRQGEIVHTTLHSRNNTHTVHHHGIEGTTFNDGVGHLSFEVDDIYTYQFQANEAGTHLYHCHKNTVLHFQRGMFGFLIVDPPEGPGRLFEGGPRYDVEKLWVVGDVDPSWQEKDDQAGLCGEDAGLNNYNPKYFHITGAFAPNTTTDPRAVIRARVGQRILVRLLCASYGVVRCTFGLPATIHGVDGRGLGRDRAPWSRPYPLPAGQALEFTPGQRYDLIMTPTAAGTFNARFEFLHWATRAIQDGGRGVATTRIIVT